MQIANKNSLNYLIPVGDKSIIQYFYLKRQIWKALDRIDPHKLIEIYFFFQFCLGSIFFYKIIIA